MPLLDNIFVQKPKHVEGKTWPAIAIGAFVAFGGVLFGQVYTIITSECQVKVNRCAIIRYDTGTISGIITMSYFQQSFSTGYRDSGGGLDMSPSQSSAIVSILSAGTFFGSLTSPALADTIGRRLALIASLFVFVLGVAFQTAAISLPLFLAGRFFAGFGVGLISALGN